jgi:hypothetical protein
MAEYFGGMASKFFKLDWKTRFHYWEAFLVILLSAAVAISLGYLPPPDVTGGRLPALELRVDAGVLAAWEAIDRLEVSAEVRTVNTLENKLSLKTIELILRQQARDSIVASQGASAVPAYLKEEIRQLSDTCDRLRAQLEDNT